MESSNNRSWLRLRYATAIAGLSALLVFALPVFHPEPAAAARTKANNWSVSFVNPCIAPKICADWYDWRGYVGSCCMTESAIDSGSLDACITGLRPRSMLPVS